MIPSKCETVEIHLANEGIGGGTYQAIKAKADAKDIDVEDYIFELIMNDITGDEMF